MSPALWIPYLRFLLQSKGRHGLHSPFAYGFVEKVLRRGDCSADAPAADPLSVTVDAAQAVAAASRVLSPRHLTYLFRLIAYWRPPEIRLLPGVAAARPALEQLFPIPVLYSEVKRFGAPALWVGKTEAEDTACLPAGQAEIVTGRPDPVSQAVVLFDAARSPVHRERAEAMWAASELPMGIDFWHGIFLASDSRFPVRQRFRLKARF